MASIAGLKGLRPSIEKVANVTAPPYDVIKEGSSLEKLLSDNPHSFYHITLGDSPAKTIEKLLSENILIEDNEPGFYIYEQNFKGGQRTGFYTAVAVDDYAHGNVVRHEKTFDAKVKGRIQLAKDTGYTLGPILLLTNSKISDLMDGFKKNNEALYDFRSEFDDSTDLHLIDNKVWKVDEQSDTGKALTSAIAENPLYIADGHHRYHAALRNEQSHTLAYIVQDADIQAYNRVINGKEKFSDIKDKLNLEEISQFTTPNKHEFHIYSKEGIYKLRVSDVSEDVVKQLDCWILEQELYGHLGCSHDMILDQKYFDYYPETALEAMKAKVNEGVYDIAVALHPVSIAQLMAVANAGLEDPEVVMPEKSTFFSPKILSGLFLYRH